MPGAEAQQAEEKGMCGQEEERLRGYVEGEEGHTELAGDGGGMSQRSNVGKLLTKIIATHMQFDCLKYNILHPGQCGGVAKHATIDAGIPLAFFFFFK